MTGETPTVCLLPEPAPERDAEIYDRLRETIIRAHCAANRDAHRCCGRITLDRSHVTLQCVLCGDARLTLRAEQSADAGGERGGS